MEPSPLTTSVQPCKIKAGLARSMDKGDKDDVAFIDRAYVLCEPEDAPTTSWATLTAAMTANQQEAACQIIAFAQHAQHAAPTPASTAAASVPASSVSMSSSGPAFTSAGPPRHTLLPASLICTPSIIPACKPATIASALPLT
ncbi:hypothetical protein JCM11251_003241 [Rhodosporidiobolus azoricus]